jgi:hypothetical protein
MFSVSSDGVNVRRAIRGDAALVDPEDEIGRRKREA